MDKICKKIFISFLLVAIFNLLVGCYSSELLTVPEYNQIEEEDKPDEMLVISKDGQEYHFAESKIYFENDTLYGKVNLIDGEELLYGKIALSDIESIQYKYLNLLTTTAFVLVLTPIILVFVLAIGIAASGPISVPY